MSDHLSALRAAAQAKGGPLIDIEVAAVYRGLDRETLRVRFLNVIRGAGYPDGTKICTEYLDRYMQDIPGFVRMLESYEQNDFDPID